MPLELLDTLIGDIIEATETLSGLEDVDLAAWQPAPTKHNLAHRPNKAGEKSSQSQMDSGIHRSVC